MNAKARRKLEMGARALGLQPRASGREFRATPRPWTRLEERLARGEQLRVAAAGGGSSRSVRPRRARRSRRAMRRAHLSHLAQVAKVAARGGARAGAEAGAQAGAHDVPGFPHRGARHGGRGAESEEDAECSVKHGLVEAVLDSLVQALDQFDAAMEQAGGKDGRAHVGASAGVQGGRRRSRPGRQRDGWSQPLPVHERGGAAGRVGEREQRAGGAAGAPRGTKPTPDPAPPTGGESRERRRERAPGQAPGGILSRRR